MSYKVTAPLVIVRDEGGASHHFYEGGVVPASGFDKDHVKMLVDDGMLEKVKEEKAPAASPDANKGPSVDDILKDVGDDKEKAAAALEQENARGDAARSTLVKKLQAVIDAAPAS